jgi:hypothetical protein
VGFALYSVIFTNGLVHLVMVLVLGEAYNPGLLTAVVLFLPLSAWIGYACFGENRLRYQAMALIIFWGVMLHVILAGSMISFVNGLIGSRTLVWMQIINAALLLPVFWLGEKRHGGVLA